MSSVSGRGLELTASWHTERSDRQHLSGLLKQEDELLIIAAAHYNRKDSEASLKVLQDQDQDQYQ